MTQQTQQALTACGRTTENVRAVTRCAATERWCHPCACSGREPQGGQTRGHPAQQKAQKSRKHLPSAVFKLAWRTRSQQLAQNQAQVERSYMDQLPLQNVLPPPQMTAPHAARLVAVREAAFDQLPASSQ